MSALIASTILLAAFCGVALLSAHQHQRQPLMIDAAARDPDTVCIHVFKRRPPNGVNQT